mgnify:CR=1 FL=1
MKKMFLASSFKDVVDQFKEFTDESLKGKTITFIPTASIPEKVVHYVYSAKDEFQKLGVIIQELDISTAPQLEIKEKLIHNDYIYVSGGNTFFLLQELRKTGADKIIIEQVNSGKLYIGESAGAMITSPNIEYAKFLDDKSKAIDLKNYDGLNLIKGYPVPHYQNEPFKKAVSNLINYYDSHLDLIPFSNSQAIQVVKNNLTVV